MNITRVKVKYIKKRKEKIKVYDIKVKDNHNFFANNILVHNCHNFGTKRLLDFFEQYEFEYMIGLSATVERIDKAHFKLLKMFDYNTFIYSPEDAMRDEVINPFSFTNIAVVMDDVVYMKYLEITQELTSILQVGHGFMNIMKMGAKNPLFSAMFKYISERKELVNNYVRKFDVISLICEKHKNDKIIIFNEFNAQTSKCYWHLTGKGLKSCIVHSGIDKIRRQQALIDFRKDKYNILLTTKVLDEGYNLPKIDVGIIMAGNSTSKQTIQRMGRVLRKKEKVSKLYQIYCLGTVEEKYANKRAQLFNSLCTNYEQLIYDERGVLI